MKPTPINKRYSLLVFLLLYCLQTGSARATENSEPRLVLFMVIDQARYDYVERFRPHLKGGLKYLLDHGVVFTEAYHHHAITRSAPGHAALVTGLHPSRSGMIANSWYDRTAQNVVYSVGDVDAPILLPRIRSIRDQQRSLPGRSTRNLRGTALSDWLKSKDPLSRVFSLGGKDRTSILIGGKEPDGVFWYDAGYRFWLTSLYYMESYPNWIRGYNEKLRGPETFNESLMIDFAKKLIDNEKLGDDSHLDLLALAFCTTDLIGHRVGPDSPDMLRALLAIDETLRDLIRHVDRRVGLEHVAFVVASDHGVMPLPESIEKPDRGHELDSDDVACFRDAESLLDEKWGDDDWLLFENYLNDDAIERRGIDRNEAERLLARGLSACSVVERVWTRTELLSPPPYGDLYQELYVNSFHAERSPDVVVQLKKYHTNQVGVPATHGSPYSYDRHVPFVIVFPGIEPSVVATRIHAVDLAPTLAALLDIPFPDDLDGRDRSDLLPKLRE